MKPLWKISAAGFAATAVTYGPARMGFGLFLPEFRSDFSISAGTVGLISGLGFLGFLLGLLVAYALTARGGPRLPVLVGLVAAALGMGIVASAPSLPILAIGVFLAMSSAGFSWAPFNDAVHDQVEDDLRPASLSAISTGTSLGIAAAGATALALSLGGASWRLAWAGFAGVSVIAALGNWAALRDAARSSTPTSLQGLRVLRKASAIPLYAIAFSFGITTAIYISFAADRIEQAGGVPGLPAGGAPAVLFIAYGIIGLLGLATSRIKAKTGLTWLLRLLLLASTFSLLLVALAPTSWAGVLLSAGFQGIYVMMMSAVLAFWSERLFPELPSLSFTAALLAVAVGSVLGPTVAGFAADAMGAGPMLIGAAAVPAATAVLVRARSVRERADAD